MSDPARISVQDARAKLQNGDGFLLVCAYPEDEKFKKMTLEGAIAFSALEQKLDSLSKETGIAFY